MKEQLANSLERSRIYTMAVADAMPANLYRSKPAGAGWDLLELMNHIAYGIQWWTDNYIRKTETAWDPPAVEETKEQTITRLSRAYGSLQDILNKEQLNEEKTYGFHATLDHITHHRGQAVLHLRCQGIEPPEYIY
jgi:uncharacterized damage-inducible protein DinB